ncbi:unnamed protein product, partial [Vitis vinifera]
MNGSSEAISRMLYICLKGWRIPGCYFSLI